MKHKKILLLLEEIVISAFIRIIDDLYNGYPIFSWDPRL